MSDNVPCPICGAQRSRFLYASPAGEDRFARAAKLSPESSITTCFCLKCGVIFNAPRFLGELSVNVYEKALPTHPHGFLNFKEIFNVPWAGILSPTVFKTIVRAVRRYLGNSKRPGFARFTALIRSFRGGSLPLNLRLEQDLNILEALLAQGGKPPFRPRKILTVGCPLMAFMPLALKKRLNSQLDYFVAFGENYWGKACRINGTDCVRSCEAFSDAVRIENWEELGGYDFIYIAECLDHAYDIPLFLQKLGCHLNPGGLMCVQNHMNFERMSRVGRFAAQHSVVFTRRSWRNLLSLIGYEELGIAFDERDFYSLLRVAGISGHVNEPTIEEYEALRARLKAIACKTG